MTRLSNQKISSLRRMLMCAGTLLILAHSTISYADRDDMPYIRAAIAAGELKTVQEIASIANKAIPGHISSIELDHEYNILAYEVKIIESNGARRRMDINAKTGEILSRF